MATLLELQKNVIDLRLGTFIHFKSATFQFHTGPIEDWEFNHENNGNPVSTPSARRTGTPLSWTANSGQKSPWTAVSASPLTPSSTTKALPPGPLSILSIVYSATSKTDVVTEYLKSFREASIVAGLYFSVLDLTSSINHNTCTEAHREMIKGPITELLINYGEIPFLIRDNWNAPWGVPSYEMLPFEEIVVWSPAAQLPADEHRLHRGHQRNRHCLL